MKEYKHNDNKLKEKDIKEEKTMVKVLLYNGDSVALTFDSKFYDFVGIDVLENETFEDAIKRIFKNDFEISIPGDSIPSYSYHGEYDIKDYPRRNINTRVNVYYYIIPLEDKTYSSSDELEFKVLNIEDAINLLSNHLSYIKLNRLIGLDELDILNDYKNNI